MAFTGWDQLQPELIETIANYLTAYIDYIRFRAVCTSWRSAVPKFSNTHPQIPWLMIPFWVDESTNDRGFFRLSENKFHILELPEFIGKRVCGSSLGWLLMLEKGPAIDLFNPITRTLIQLPPLTAFPHVKFRPLKENFKIYHGDGDNETYSLMRMQNCFIRKMALSSSPSNDDGEDYMIVIILQYENMAYMKKGDQVWTLLEGPESYIRDVIFHKGHFFALDCKNRVVKFRDFDGSSPNVNVISSGPEGGNCVYLVDCSGDLLLIRTTLDDNYEHTLKFEVFKPDGNQSSLPSSSDEWEWHEVKDLGECVLFLGPNSSLSLVAHEFSGCRRNCIYFTGNSPRNWDYFVNDYSDSEEEEEDSNKLGAHDVGVFDLNDGSITPILEHLFSNWVIWPPPTWVTPNPN